MAQQAAVRTEITPNRSFLGTVFASTWQGLVKDLRAPYRPERHYMRGPGPKWHAKHMRAAAEAERSAR